MYSGRKTAFDEPLQTHPLQIDNAALNNPHKVDLLTTIKETLSCKFFFVISFFLIVIGGEYHTYHQSVKKSRTSGATF